MAIVELRQACMDGDRLLAEDLFALLDQLPGRIRPTRSELPLRLHLAGMTARLAKVAALAVAGVVGSKWWHAATDEPALLATFSGVA